jgi:DNA-binding SARP family transcriptional activator
MEFRILGPLEVRVGERVLPLSGVRQRTVLALLLLRAGEVVSSDRLIDELWGERPPPSGIDALQVYVSRLRKVLPEGTVVTEGRGYRLAVAGEQIDAGRFERMVGEGRAALAEGDPERSARLLREALDLWSGPALADFAYEPFAQGEIARLEELRVVALEERLESDLACGRSAELVGELQALVGAHPLRERLRGQLMRALYRSGRQAEALAAYQDARRALVDELGIEPSPALRDLERAILAQDPELSAAPLATAARPAPPTRTELEQKPAPEPPARKVVTVLFSDVVGSSALAAELDPERLERVLGRFFDAAVKVVVGHGGTVDKFIGDEVMAVFGVPRVHEDDAVRALRAALDLRDVLAALNDQLQRDWGVRIAVRTGVNTGEVVTGDPVSGRLVTGDSVVVATRLVQSAKAGDVLVGERTAAAAAGAFEFGEAHVVAAKGRKDSVRAHRLLRALSWDRPRGVPSAGRVFVGRRAELDLLTVTHERVVSSGEPHLVAILGEPGVGKTTLIGELRERLDDGLAWHLGRCLAYGRAATYQPLAEILRGRLGLDDAEPEEAVLARLGGRGILALTLGHEPDARLHPQEARRQLQEAWVELLNELADEGPTVVVVEDLHWAQDALLELLERAVRQARGPLLMLVTARPELVERSPAWTAGAANASQLRLEPLSGEEAVGMLAELAGPLPEHLRDLVLDRAEGNPFFVEEAFAALIDRGVVGRGPEGWTVLETPAQLPVPDSVQGVIAARVDLLPSVDKEALQAASVVGRTFWEGAVRELLDGASFDPGLLEERGFVRVRRESTLGDERELVFKHALTREVAYGALPLARRARLHARVAEWLERTGADAEEHASLLAHHYAEAAAPAIADLAWPNEEARTTELRDRAIRWLRRAAALAVGRYEIQEAVSLLNEALALAGDDNLRTDLLLEAARACRLRYDTDGFRAALEQALSLDPPAAVSAEIHSQLAIAGSMPELWREPPSLEVIDRWAQRALALAEPGSRAHAVSLMARARAWPGSGRDSADEARALADQIGDPALVATALQTQTDVAVAQGAHDEARRLMDHALQIVPATGDPYEREGLLLYATIVYARDGRIAEARRLAAEHDALATRLSPHQEVHGVGLDLIVETAAGDWEAARALSGRAEAASAANRDTPCQFNWRALLMAALAHAQLGDEREARRLEQQALGTVEVSGPASREPAMLRLALLRGELEAVEQLLAAPGAGKYDVSYAATRLDALVAVGDREGVEREAPPVLALGGYAAPFALRALAAVRAVRAPREQVAAAFDALDLAFFAAETRASN